jgi:hypothetical protein
MTKTEIKSIEFPKEQVIFKDTATDTDIVFQIGLDVPIPRIGESVNIFSDDDGEASDLIGVVTNVEWLFGDGYDVIVYVKPEEDNQQVELASLAEALALAVVYLRREERRLLPSVTYAQDEAGDRDRADYAKLAKAIAVLEELGKLPVDPRPQAMLQ